MEKSESIKELAVALTKAQPEIEGATKDKTNPHFKSKYADLSSVAEAITGPLKANGLAYVQVAHDRENAAAIETIIVHSSGEWMSAGIVSVPVSKHDAQGFGSALTYARRYSLSSAFGVIPEDDDGNAAANSPRHSAPAARPPTKPTAEQETKAMDWCAAIEECTDLDTLRHRFERAWAEVHAFGFPMLDNLLIAAKDKRKVALSERKAA